MNSGRGGLGFGDGKDHRRRLRRLTRCAGGTPGRMRLRPKDREADIVMGAK